METLREGLVSVSGTSIISTHGLTYTMPVKFKKVNGGEDLETPAYQSRGAAGMDLRANISEPVVLKPGERMLIGTGIALELTPEQVAFVVPRSGLAKNFGISIVNSPGTVDSDYRGEIFVNLINLGQEDFTIERGDRIAQVIIQTFIQARLIEATELSETERGNKGHSSTGVK